MEAARQANRLVTVFHNRRWDGDFQTMRRVIVEEGLLGDVFHIEGYRGGFKAPKYRWRDERDISGGTHYDWGAHGMDQALQLLPGCEFDTVYGIHHPNRVWKDVSNEDQIQTIVRFKGGEVLDMQFSRIAHANRPAWRILGTKGALVSWNDSSIKLYSQLGEHQATADIPCGPNKWGGFYRNLAEHLLYGKPLVITPSDAARVVAVLDYTSRSAQQGQILKMPCS
jgi:predicted dehydrogenase